jgi:hypothetical protein
MEVAELTLCASVRAKGRARLEPLSGLRVGAFLATEDTAQVN